MSDPKKSKVQLIVSKTHKFKETDRLLVLIDPQFADLADYIEDDLRELVGHDKVQVLALHPDAVKFYAIEQDDRVHLQINPPDKSFTDLGPIDGN